MNEIVESPVGKIPVVFGIIHHKSYGVENRVFLK